MTDIHDNPPAVAPEYCPDCDEPLSAMARSLAEVRATSLHEDSTMKAQVVAQGARDRSILAAYLAGATLQAIAESAGLTRQRIQQIVSERGER